jgi:hypothetical protein
MEGLAMTAAKKIRLPVVDGDTGADIYGYATTRTGAMRVGRRSLIDGCADAYLAENIQCADGRRLARAWIALTPYGAAG